jgi:hypothetical protein
MKRVAAMAAIAPVLVVYYTTTRALLPLAGSAGTLRVCEDLAAGSPRFGEQILMVCRYPIMLCYQEE